MNQFGRISELKIVASQNKKGKTFIKDSFFTSPFKIMKPFSRTDGGITVFQQTASAGIMAGDEQKHTFFVENGAILELVSQSFEKIFKMEDNGPAERKINSSVEHGGTLIYAPLPCMPFAGSNFFTRTKICLEDNSSKLVYQDCICAGRKASGELFDYKKYHNLIEIECAGNLVYRDNTLFEGSDCGKFPEKKDFLKTAAMYGNYSHLGSMLIFNYNLKPLDIMNFLHIEKKLLYNAENIGEIKKSAPLVGITSTEGNGIAVRVLANSAEQVQQIFEKIKIN